MIQIIAAISILCMLFYAAYILWNYYYFAFRTNPIPVLIQGEILPSVTLIIPARNEEKYIGSLLDDILQQNYPADKLQVIVMDDFSTDSTAEICREKMSARAHWKLIPLIKPQGNAYKKAAITQAIAVASGEIILTTDADCTAGPDWVLQMVSAMLPDTGLVSGPVCMWDDGSWFQQFQALEFIGLISIGAASMTRNQPNMCNGANLAYRRQVFYEVGGFEGIDHIASGDDELLMHKIQATGKYKVRFQKAKEAIVRTAPCTSFTQFVNQRIRWVSKSTHYKNTSITFIMSLIYLAMLSIPVSVILAVLNPEYIFLPCFLLLLKIIPEAFILFSGTRFFGRKELMFWFLPEQILHIPYILWAGLAGNLKQYAWKERLVK